MADGFVPYTALALQMLQTTQFQGPPIPQRAGPKTPSKGKAEEVQAVVPVSTPDPPKMDKPVARPAPEFDDSQVMAQSVSSPPSPKEYIGLQVGVGMSIELEASPVPQVELSNSLLRNLSPFMIRVEPPLVYGENGGFQNKQTNSTATDFSASAGTSLTNYDMARRALQQSKLSGLSGNNASVEETITRNSKGAQKNTLPTGDKSDSQGNIGQPAIADVYTAVDIAMQLAAIAKVPPLVLLINPTTMSINRSKVAQYSDRSRHGFIYHAWGNDQPKLSITARCGAFVSGGRGVHAGSKRDSLAWQNLMNAFQFYRNNGYIYDTVGKSNAHHLVGALSIHYDGWIYFGHMESFTWTFDEEHMHGGIEFSIEFTASSIVDTSQQVMAVTPMKSPIPSLSDPRYQGMINRARNPTGEFALGAKGLSTQGRAVGVGDAFGTLVPQNAVQVFVPGFHTPQTTSLGTTNGLPNAPPGGSTGGFQPQAVEAVLPGQRAVNIQTPNLVEPFRGA